jgi:hypothetical protein
MPASVSPSLLPSVLNVVQRAFDASDILAHAASDIIRIYGSENPSGWRCIQQNSTLTLSANERQNAVRSGALLVHYNLQMTASNANDSVLGYSKQMKRGEYKQGRMV